MGDGYFLIARKLLKHPRFKPKDAFSRLEAWLWLLEAAAYQPREVPIMMGNHRQIITLQPGQISHSIRFLALAWRWSPNRVQRFLDDLEMDHSVDTATDTAQTVITLCNWDKYQRPNLAADTATDTATNTKKKEVKEIKKHCASGAMVGFEEWYSIYPRKKQPQAAKRAFEKTIRSGAISLEALMGKTRAFAAGWQAEPKDRLKFIPYPASWLNAGGYLDEQDGAETSPAARDARTFSDNDWQRRLKHFQDNAEWLDTWGPQPGAPGCFVPSHLILSPVSESQGAA